jgi:tetratricopeptide (TPR) repeat protein
MENAEALLLEADKRKEAVAEYEKCLEYKPDHWEAHHGIAVNLLHAEDSEDMGMSGLERKRKALLHAKKAFELAGPPAQGGGYANRCTGTYRKGPGRAERVFACL